MRIAIPGYDGKGTPSMTLALSSSHLVLGASLPGGAAIGFAIAFFAAFFAALWLSTIIWTWRDIRSRTQDVILQVFGTVLTAVFPGVGILIYLILRPRQTLADLYERQLEEESLLAEMTERRAEVKSFGVA